MSLSLWSAPSKRRRKPLTGNHKTTGAEVGSDDEYESSIEGYVCGRDFRRLKMSWREAPRTAGQAVSRIAFVGRCAWSSYSESPDLCPERLKLMCSDLPSMHWIRGVENMERTVQGCGSNESQTMTLLTRISWRPCMSARAGA